MNERTKAYIAGLFDGEGSIFIRIGTVKHKDKTYTHFIPQVSISMTHKGTMDYLVRELNVGIYRPIQRGKWRTQYYLCVSKRKEIQSVLTVLLPYLRTKKEQAEMMLSFCDNRHSKLTYNIDLETRCRLQKLNSPR